MHSFATLTVLASLAFGSYAAPVAQLPDVSDVPVVGGLVNTAESLVGGALNGRQLPDVSSVPVVGGLVNTAEGLVGGALRRRQIPDVSSVPVVGGVASGALNTVEGVAGGVLSGRQTVGPDLSGVPVVGDVAKGVVGTVEGLAGGVLSGRQAPTTLVTVLAGLSAKVIPVAQQLTFLTPANATEAAVTPLINDIKTALTTAVSDAKALVGKPASEILVAAQGEAQVAVGDLAKTLATVLSAVVGGLGQLVKVAAGKFDAAPLVASIGGLVGSLLATVLSLVGGLLAALVPLIQGLVPTLLSLNLSAVLSVLQL